MVDVTGFAVTLRCYRATAHHPGQAVVGISDDPDRIGVRLSSEAAQQAVLRALSATGYVATATGTVVRVTGWDLAALEARAAALLVAAGGWERYHASVAKAAVAWYRETRQIEDQASAQASVLSRIRRAIPLPTPTPSPDSALTHIEADTAGLDAAVRAQLRRIAALELTIEKLNPGLADTGQAAISLYEWYRPGCGEEAAARQAVIDTADRIEVLRDLALHEAEHRDHPDLGDDHVLVGITAPATGGGPVAGHGGHR